jgi:hypothetical protein
MIEALGGQVASRESEGGSGDLIGCPYCGFVSHSIGGIGVHVYHSHPGKRDDYRESDFRLSRVSQGIPLSERMTAPEQVYEALNRLNFVVFHRDALRRLPNVFTSDVETDLTLEDLKRLVQYGVLMVRSGEGYYFTYMGKRLVDGVGSDWFRELHQGLRDRL